MVHTLRRMVDTFLHNASDFSGHISDDRIYSKKVLAQMIIETRAEVVRGALNANQSISEHYQQLVDCIELEEVDIQECPCAPESGCTWLKSKEPIPEAIQIISVTDTVAKEQFSRKKWTDFKRVKNSRIKSSLTRRYYTIRESGDGTFYLYLYTKQADKKFLKAVSMMAIFSDPLKASAFAGCGEPNLNAICAPLDQPIFICEELRPRVMNNLYSILPQIKANAPQDEINNDRADRQRFERRP